MLTDQLRGEIHAGLEGSSNPGPTPAQLASIIDQIPSMCVYLSQFDDLTASEEAVIANAIENPEAFLCLFEGRFEASGDGKAFALHKQDISALLLSQSGDSVLACVPDLDAPSDNSGAAPHELKAVSNPAATPA